MNIIDAIILICLIPAIFQGLKKGFISQAISIVSIIAGIWASSRFADIVTDWVAQYITASEQILKIVAFAIILIAAFLILGMLGRLLEKLLDFIFLGWANKLLGTIFSLLKAFLILGLIALIINSICASLNCMAPEVFNTSVLYQTISESAGKIFPYIKDMLTIN